MNVIKLEKVSDPLILPQTQYAVAPIKASLWDSCLLLSTSQLDGYLPLAFLTPQMNTVPNIQTLTVPLAAHTQSKRVIQFIPLLVGLGITAGIGMGIGGIASSTTYYHTQSKDFTDYIERVAKSLVASQDQLDSLAEVIFTE